MALQDMSAQIVTPSFGAKKESVVRHVRVELFTTNAAEVARSLSLHLVRAQNPWPP